MNSTIIFLAQLMAPCYLVVAFLLVFRGKLFNAIMDDFNKSPALSYFGGVIALVVGITWLLHIFSWDSFTETVFTILGMLIVTKGVFLLLFPEVIFKINYKHGSFKIFGTILVIVLGIWFTNIGYGPF